MQTVRKLRKRSGFTLVELLIVIIIIGILAGAMLLVAGSGTDSAEATKIISDLRGMKSAALLYYADNPVNPDKPEVVDLEKYMDRELKDTDFVVFETVSKDWWIGHKTTKSSGVQGKLADRAAEVGLYGGDDTKPTTSTVYAAGTNGNNVWIKAR